jgi:hypothetical protein
MAGWLSRPRITSSAQSPRALCIDRMERGLCPDIDRMASRAPNVFTTCRPFGACHPRWHRGAGWSGGRVNWAGQVQQGREMEGALCRESEASGRGSDSYLTFAVQLAESFVLILSPQASDKNFIRGGREPIDPVPRSPIYLLPPCRATLLPIGDAQTLLFFSWDINLAFKNTRPIRTPVITNGQTSKSVHHVPRWQRRNCLSLDEQYLR